MENLSRRTFLGKIGVSASVIAVAKPPLKNVSKVVYEGEKLNIALCGLGRYAGYLADGLEISQYCRLAGIVTGTPTKAEDWKKRYNIPQKNIYNYQNFDEIVNNKDIDLVYVVLPNSMHKEFVIRAAKAGKHVIVEKPMAITAKDCQEMIDACKKAGVQLAVGYRLHFEPYHKELKRLGQEKVFGQVRLIEVSLGYRLGGENPKDWHLVKEFSGGGPLMNLGVYCVQSSRYVLGEEPISVSAQFAPVTNKTLFSEVEESITWQLVFPSGAVCTSTSSYNCGIDRFFAAADDGFFELSPAVSYGPFKGRTSKGELDFPTINQQTTQMDEIGKVLIENKQLPTHISGEEGLKDMKILEAIYEAANTGKKVTIN
ncbi:Glucose--fructose oxidoreductase [Emticicia aquatica]|uniref:Glucose--fructose oxidoreductase n=1 Tax=Emticicia aquatica TaxID=1681835 RepID=A0ABN8EPP0_9BACT|nr:Gfo/Idh/MocA family oxidoreductase [Emticicia aquatica]CAH0994904.1 Glucose--fructose oxidoreductase [Emticicia aquatica]